MNKFVSNKGSKYGLFKCILCDWLLLIREMVLYFNDPTKYFKLNICKTFGSEHRIPQKLGFWFIQSVILMAQRNEVNQ